jgi:glycosyltransferase involved in cell wall biosynthesis
LFLQALQQVIAQYGSKVRAFVIGDGEERNNIEQLAQQLNIATATHEQAVAGYRAALTFTSWIKEVDEAYAGLDVVALSSLNEGTPVSLIEAQAAGKAIVSTQVGGVADVVSSGKTALLVPSNDTNAFANALAKLVGNEGLRRKLSKNAPAHVEDRYSYRRLTNDMAHLYDQLLHEKVPHYTPAYDLQTSNQIPVFQTMPQVAGFRPMVSRK